MEATRSETEYFRPQVKICGLTGVDEAVACAELGADAIGLVFYPPSPRYVSEEVAREIARQLPERCRPVGVFVNEPYSAIMRKIEKCELKAVQLHGKEPPELACSLMKSGIPVIKSLFPNRPPLFGAASSYNVSAILVEGGAGPLPGGNAMTWEWRDARSRVGEIPLILAGGLNVGNIREAIEEVCPDAVDVSSGVESHPGRKDIDKVRAFMEAMRLSQPNRRPGRIFI